MSLLDGKAIRDWVKGNFFKNSGGILESSDSPILCLKRIGANSSRLDFEGLDGYEVTIEGYRNTEVGRQINVFLKDKGNLSLLKIGENVKNVYDYKTQSTKEILVDGDDIGNCIVNDKSLSENLSEVFQSVSNGKSLIAAAITDKGVETAADDTFQTMATNIGNIQTGGGSGITSPIILQVYYNDTFSRNASHDARWYFNIPGVKKIKLNLNYYVGSVSSTSYNFTCRLYLFNDNENFSASNLLTIKSISISTSVNSGIINNEIDLSSYEEVKGIRLNGGNYSGNSTNQGLTLKGTVELYF